MAQLNWNLERLLKDRGLTKYELAKRMSGNEKSRLTTLYRMQSPQRVDLGVTADIVAALRELTGEDISANDLLEFVPDPAPLDAETEALMSTDLSGVGRVEPYDFGPEGDPKGQAFRHVAGKGLLVTDDSA